jgi:integrase
MERRHQRGYLYKFSGAWHVRYRLDGAQHSKRLCDDGRSKSAAKQLCSYFMETEVNGLKSHPTKPTAVTIVAFWEQTYWPFVVDNLKASTQWGYKQVWNQHLKEHFGTMTLSEYRTHHGSLFLTKLAKTYSQRTVQHIKNICSGIFTHAINSSEIIETNPWHDCKVLGKIKKPGVTKHYTLEEIENIISALVDSPMGQLIMALSFFLGLRKGEIAGLKWSDIDPEWLHVRRNVARGVVGTPKTEKSVRSLPLIQPVRGLLMLWKSKAGDGLWLFQSATGNPLDMDWFSATVIRPTLAKGGCTWKGYHAGRRGLGTVLRQITGNSIAGRDTLGHEDEAITQDFYEAKARENVHSALKMLEAKTLSK